MLINLRHGGYAEPMATRIVRSFVLQALTQNEIFEHIELLPPLHRNT